MSALKHVDVVIGNSSSGLTEVPSFNKPTINIGNRQKGRLKANSVLDCNPIAEEISESISGHRRMVSFLIQPTNSIDNEW